MAHEPIAPRGNQIMNRRLRTLTFSLSLFVLAAAHPTHAADGLAYVGTRHDGSSGVNGLRSADAPLFFVERKRDSVDGVDGLAGINAVAVSPDGMNVYATGGADDALATFMRDATTGTLTFLGAEPGLNGPQAIAISPDGAYLYVASGNAVVVFARDPASGMLTVVQIVDDDTDGVDGLGGAAALAVSPDGGHLYAAGKLDDSVAVFSRDSASGALAFVEVDRQAVDGV